MSRLANCRGWGGSIVRCEEGQDIPDQDLYFLSSFDGMQSIAGIVHFSRPSLQQDSGIPVGVK